MSSARTGNDTPPNMICSSCGEDSVVEMDAQTVCTTCGTVLSENGIVSEITFGETSGGAAMVQGSYVGADQSALSSLCFASHLPKRLT